MTDQTLVEQLRAFCVWSHDKPLPLTDEAASEIERLQARCDLAIWELVELTCACPYDPGAEGEGAQLMGPICHRCAVIHLLNGGDLPKAALAPPVKP